MEAEGPLPSSFPFQDSPEKAAGGCSLLGLATSPGSDISYNCSLFLLEPTQQNGSETTIRIEENLIHDKNMEPLFGAVHWLTTIFKIFFVHSEPKLKSKTNYTAHILVSKNVNR